MQTVIVIGKPFKQKHVYIELAIVAVTRTSPAGKMGCCCCCCNLYFTSHRNALAILPSRQQDLTPT